MDHILDRCCSSYYTIGVFVGHGNGIEIFELSTIGLNLLQFEALRIKNFKFHGNAWN